MEDFLESAALFTRMDAAKRAFFRGAFLTAGSMSDPHKSYHFEIVCASEEKAELLKKLIQGFEMDAKVVKRKKSFVVYLKEGTQISLALNVMDAPVALMEFENIRILKEMRNTVNRKVNCETANIHKTVSAAVKQMEDITYIKDYIGFEKLSDGLRGYGDGPSAISGSDIKRAWRADAGAGRKVRGQSQAAPSRRNC